jgi:hypothetical protein
LEDRCGWLQTRRWLDKLADAIPHLGGARDNARDASVDESKKLV